MWPTDDLDARGPEPTAERIEDVGNDSRTQIGLGKAFERDVVHRGAARTGLADLPEAFGSQPFVRSILSVAARAPDQPMEHRLTYVDTRS